jgi:type I restriction enzyme M protein
LRPPRARFTTTASSFNQADLRANHSGTRNPAEMLTGEIRNQVDQVWNAFWSGGVSNPLSVIEQITYLLFIKRLDDLHTLEESKAQTLGIPMERRVFPDGADERGRAYADMRWSRFKNFEPREMMTVVADHVFPFLRTLGEEGSSYGGSSRPRRPNCCSSRCFCGC